MVKKTWCLLLAVAFLAAGCTALTPEQFAQIHEGMSQREVLKTLGEPVAARKVLFKGHESDYLVWEYMVPDDRPT